MKREDKNHEPSTVPSKQEEGETPVQVSKKPFVEPVVSVPQDVLEATAFFQGSAALNTADA